MGPDLINKWWTISSSAGAVKGFNSLAHLAQSSSQKAKTLFSFFAQSPTLASIDVLVPADADAMSFDLSVLRSGNNELLLVAADNDVLLSIGLDGVLKGGTETFAVLVKQYAGTIRTLSFFMPSDEPSDAQFVVSSVRFLTLNRPPIAELIPNQTVRFGQTLGLTATAIDPDGDSVQFFLDDTSPEGARINSQTGFFTWTPTENIEPRQYVVQVIVTDDGPGNPSSLQTFTVSVVATPWQNPVDPLDVNADSVVSPIDALLVINYLNGIGSDPLPPPSPPPFLDINGDNHFSPIDVLLIINFLNNPTIPEGEFVDALTQERHMARLKYTDDAFAQQDSGYSRSAWNYTIASDPFAEMLHQINGGLGSRHRRDANLTNLRQSTAAATGRAPALARLVPQASRSDNSFDAPWLEPVVLDIVDDVLRIWNDEVSLTSILADSTIKQGQDKRAKNA